MKSKYVMISGFAFSEETDMEKLKKYARQGWILEDIVGGFFYKLKKDKPQDIVYTLDYQMEADEEYFTLFKEAGWELVISIGNQMHIFSAPAGTKPIYSDSQSEIDKYTSIRNGTRRGTIYSAIIGIALIGLLALSVAFIRPIFLIILGLLLIDMVVFVFNFMPYLMYNFRIKQIKKYGKCNSEMMNNKSLWKVNALTGVGFLTLGILNLIEKEYFSVFFIILGASSIISSLDCYKKYKKSL